MNGWIPVTERLPELEQSVLILDDGMHAIAKTFSDDREPGGVRWVEKLYEGYSRMHINVTHWQPLPGLPEEEETTDA